MVKKSRKGSHSEKQCAHKKIYPTVADARKAAERVEKDIVFSRKFGYYYCKLHNGFHTGHIREGWKNAT